MGDNSQNNCAKIICTLRKGQFKILGDEKEKIPNGKIDKEIKNYDAKKKKRNPRKRNGTRE